MTHKINSESSAKILTASDKNPRYVPNQLIVRLKRELAADQEARCQVIKSLPEESTMLRDFDELGIAVFELPNDTDPSAVARAVETHPLVDYAEPNYIDKGNET